MNSTSSNSPRSPQSRATSGFTLLELMVALALFSLGVVSLLVVKKNSLEEAYMARKLHLARLLGQAVMEDLILGTRDYEDGEAGDVWALDGEDLEVFKIDDYAEFYWEVSVEEITLAGDGSSDAEQDEDEDDQGGFFDDFDRERRRDTQGKSTSRRADPSSEGKGGGGLFGGGGGGGEEDEENDGQAILALRLRVIITFPLTGDEGTLEFETMAPFINDTLFEGIEGSGGESQDPGAGQPGDADPRAPGNNDRNRQNQGRSNAARELFGDG